MTSVVLKTSGFKICNPQENRKSSSVPKKKELNGSLESKTKQKERRKKRKKTEKGEKREEKEVGTWQEAAGEGLLVLILRDDVDGERDEDDDEGAQETICVVHPRGYCWCNRPGRGSVLVLIRSRLLSLRHGFGELDRAEPHRLTDSAADSSLTLLFSGCASAVILTDRRGSKRNRAQERWTNESNEFPREPTQLLLNSFLSTSYRPSFIPAIFFLFPASKSAEKFINESSQVSAKRPRTSLFVSFLSLFFFRFNKLGNLPWNVLFLSKQDFDLIGCFSKGLSSLER